MFADMYLEIQVLFTELRIIGLQTKFMLSSCTLLLSVFYIGWFYWKSQLPHFNEVIKTPVWENCGIRISCFISKIHFNKNLE